MREESFKAKALPSQQGSFFWSLENSSEWPSLLFAGLAGVPGTFCAETVSRVVGGTRVWNPARLRGASLPRTWVTPSEVLRASWPCARLWV